MTETKIPDPGCPHCAGTGVIPPFMDDCSCLITVDAVMPTERPKMDADLAVSLEASAFPATSWSADAEAAWNAAVAAGAVPHVDPRASTIKMKVGGEWRDVKVEALSPAEYAAKHGGWKPPTAEPVSEATAVVVGPPVKAISDAQVTLMKRLVAERDAEHPIVKSAVLALEATPPTSAKHASTVIDQLMKLPRTKEVPRPNKFAGVCHLCRASVGAGAGTIVKIDGKWKTRHADGGCLSAEAKAARDSQRVDEPGLYSYQSDAIYRVRKSRTSKRLYAERIHAHTDDDGERHVSFSYDGHAIHLLSKTDKLTWKQARDFGAAYGACVACGRTLSDAASLVQGYGKTCAGHYGWPVINNKTAEAIIAGALTWQDATSAFV